jgi:hypothetical protein
MVPQASGGSLFQQSAPTAITTAMWTGSSRSAGAPSLSRCRDGQSRLRQCRRHRATHCEPSRELPFQLRWGDWLRHASDNKGPEPEGVVVGQAFGLTVGFIGLERVGDVLMYELSNPAAPRLLGFFNAGAISAPKGSRLSQPPTARAVSRSSSSRTK